MNLPDSDEDFDFTPRHVTRQFPEQLARALLPAGAIITSARRGLGEAILTVLSEEDVMQSPVYEMGKRRGEEAGELKVIVRGCERRLGRPLSESERSTITQRMATLGMDRLIDVQQALSPDALAAWLGDPAAT